MTTVASSSIEEKRTTSLGWALPLTAIFMRFGLIMLGNLIYYAVFSAQGVEEPWFRALLMGNIHVVLIADVGTVAFLVWALRREGLRIRDLVRLDRSKPLLKDIGLGLLIGIGAYIVLMAGGLAGALIVYGPSIFQFDASAFEAIDPSTLPPLSYYLWGLTVLPISVGIVEELVYRGYAQERLESLTGNAWIAVFIMALGFGVQHMAFSATSLQDMIARFIGTFIAGIFFGAIYIKHRRLLPLIIGHWLVDVVGLGIFPLLMYFALTAG